MQLRRHSRKPLLFLLSLLCLGGFSLSDFLPGLGLGTERVLISAVSDGDTLRAADGRRIRLYGVDCPEKRQSRGADATAITQRLTLGRTVQLETVDQDTYGRVVAIVGLDDGSVLQEELLKAGAAWFYDQYCRRPVCIGWQTLESSARKHKVGLWSDPVPVPPWVWRKNREGQ